MTNEEKEIARLTKAMTETFGQGGALSNYMSYLTSSGTMAATMGGFSRPPAPIPTKKEGPLITLEIIIEYFYDLVAPVSGLEQPFFKYNQDAPPKFNDTIPYTLQKEVISYMKAVRSGVGVEVVDEFKAVVKELWRLTKQFTEITPPAEVLSALLEKEDMPTPDPKLLNIIITAMEAHTIGNLKHYIMLHGNLAEDLEQDTRAAIQKAFEELGE